MLLAGFPLALALSWFYRLTPEGLKRELDADETGSLASRANPAANFAIIAVLALGVALLLFELIPGFELLTLAENHRPFGKVLLHIRDLVGLRVQPLLSLFLFALELLRRLPADLALREQSLGYDNTDLELSGRRGRLCERAEYDGCGRKPRRDDATRGARVGVKIRKNHEHLHLSVRPSERGSEREQHDLGIGIRGLVDRVTDLDS